MTYALSNMCFIIPNSVLFTVVATSPTCLKLYKKYCINLFGILCLFVNEDRIQIQDEWCAYMWITLLQQLCKVNMVITNNKKYSFVHAIRHKYCLNVIIKLKICLVHVICNGKTRSRPGSGFSFIPENPTQSWTPDSCIPNTFQPYSYTNMIYRG